MTSKAEGSIPSGSTKKKCSRCGKKRECYPNRGTCKECHRKDMKARSKKHYQKNKPYYLDRNKKLIKGLRALIRELKKKPCADCKVEYPYYVMDFDHRPGEEKVMDVSQIASFGSKKKILEEISKCDVVCANCHRIRGHVRVFGTTESPWEVRVSIQAEAFEFTQEQAQRMLFRIKNQ